MSQLPQIYAFGETVRDGLFIDLANDPAAYIVTPNEAHFVFRYGTVPGFPASGVIPNSYLVRFQVEAVNATKHVLNEDRRLKVVVEYRDRQQKRRKLDLGIIEKYGAAKNWTDTANLHVRAHQLKQDIPDRINERSKIIIEDDQIRALPSWCIADGEPEYKSKWMEYYVEHTRTLITAGTNRCPRIIWRHWPSADQTWDKIFGRILLPEEGRPWPTDRVDICFEPYFLDQHRESLNYSVARIGTLPNFLFTYTNTRLMNQGTQNAEPRAWNDICSYFDQNTQVRRPKAGYLVGTTTANFFTGELDKQAWPVKSSKAIDTIDDLAEWLLNDQMEEDRCVVADFAIVEAVKRQQGRQALNGNLKQIRVRYPNEVIVGIPFDRRDLIWGGVLEDSLAEIIQSDDVAVLNSWKDTAARLERIGVVVD